MGIMEAVEDMRHFFYKKWHDIIDKKIYRKNKYSVSKNDMYENNGGYGKRGKSGNGTPVSDTDMINRLKILMSIPISSAEYPKDNLDEFLEKIWVDKVKTFEVEAHHNVFTLYKGRLGLLKKYAKEKNKIRVRNNIDSLLDSLDKEIVKLSTDVR